MLGYIKGTIIEIGTNYVVIDNNGMGYIVYVSNPYLFKENDETTIFLYNHIREDEYTLYGFKTKEEKELFLRLINVKGLGPKMALPMFATGSVNGIVDAIDRENVLYLTKFPKIGDKLARQIILDLKGKLTISSNESFGGLDELTSVLENLGYKAPDIKRVLKDINPSDTIEVQVKEALKLLLK